MGPAAPVPIGWALAEAYLGPRDLASHSARGRTPRNATLSGPSGHAGIELIDGVHHCPE